MPCKPFSPTGRSMTAAIVLESDGLATGAEEGHPAASSDIAARERRSFFIMRIS